MEEKQRALPGFILLATFAVFLACYFWASYMGQRTAVRIQERNLTAHDDLFSVDGRHDGNRAAVGKFGLILLTQDGGKTWSERPAGTHRPLTSVSFGDNQHGFVVGGGGTILASDGGDATWRAQNSGTRDQLLGVYALSPVQAFAVGSFGTLLSTSDGGRNWSKHDLKWDVLIERIVKEGGYVEPNLNAVYFNSSQNGWIVGEFGLVLHTKDGGRTWVSQRYGGDFPQLYAVKFLDDRRGWAIGQAGSFIQTRDGGQRWSSVDLAIKRDFYDISLEGERGVMVGDGVVLVSHDGGSSWKSMGSSQEEQGFNSVALKSSEAIAVGQAGTIRLLPIDNVTTEKERQAR